MTIPLDVLFGEPDHRSPRLSLDGEHVFFLRGDGGSVNACTRAVDSGRERRVTHERDAGITDFWVLPDGEHVVYLHDPTGAEEPVLKKTRVRDGKTTVVAGSPGTQVLVLAVSRTAPSRAVVGLNDRDPELHDAYLVDFTDDSTCLLAENPGFSEWVLTSDLEPVGGWRARDDAGLDVLVRDGGGGWRCVSRAGPDDAFTTRPLAADVAAGELWSISSIDSDTARLVVQDLFSGDTKVLVEDPQYDVERVVLNPTTFRPEWVVIERERSQVTAVETRLEPDLRRIERAAPGDFVLESRDGADRRWVLGFTGDASPMKFFLYDRVRGRLTHLFDEQRGLEAHEAAFRHQHPFSFQARDGMDLHGYVTFPEGPRGGPGVVLVHGGPWDRDRWAFTREVQWLADRGYVCLQVNFRGSSGFGKSYLNAGNREWGGGMQRDLEDAVRHAVARGWVDPGRVAICGSSYGGYAALLGAMQPEVFRCCVAVAAPMDLAGLLRGIPDYWKPTLSFMHNRVGHPVRDADLLRLRSPAHLVDEMRNPILLVHGANDPRVPLDDVAGFAAAVRRRGIECRDIVFDDEGHGLVRRTNRVAFYSLAEEFLARHLAR